MRHSFDSSPNSSHSFVGDYGRAWAPQCFRTEALSRRTIQRKVYQSEYAEFERRWASHFRQNSKKQRSISARRWSSGFLSSRQFRDDFAMLRITLHQLFIVGQFEILEVETGGYGAAHHAECVTVFTSHFGGEPASGFYNGLQYLGGFGISTQVNAGVAAFGVDYMDDERCPQVEVPEFIGL